MTLRDWLIEKKVPAAVFAGRIGRSPEAVRRYINGERIPDKSTMPRIVAVTDGDVMPNDFFDQVAA